MDKRIAGLCAAACGGLLCLMLIAACKGSDGDDRPTEVSTNSSATENTSGVTGSGGVTTISIDTVAPPTRVSRSVATDDCTIPGFCPTTTVVDGTDTPTAAQPPAEPPGPLPSGP